MKCAWKQIMLVASSVIPSTALAQEMNASAAPLAALPADGVPAAGPHEILAALAITAAATVVLLAIAKANDFRRKREERAVDLTARISTALLEHPAFFRSSVAPTVELPLWGGSPARIIMTGDAPSPELARTALRLTRDAASRVRSDFTIENRIAVAPASAGPGADATGDVRWPHRAVDALKTVSSMVGVTAGVVLLKYALAIEQLNLK